MKVKSLMMRLKDIPQKKNTLLQLLKCDIKNIIIDKYGNYALQEALKVISLIYPSQKHRFC